MTDCGSSSRTQSVEQLPPACPQDPSVYVQGVAQSEDCLYAIVYAPPIVTPTSKVPVFVW